VTVLVHGERADARSPVVVCDACASNCDRFIAIRIMPAVATIALCAECVIRALRVDVPRRAGGRPIAMTTDRQRQAAKLIADGWPLNRIAGKLGVSRSTLTRWVREVEAGTA
jgi:DNA-binding NarL/FixJ family response regulator